MVDDLDLAACLVKLPTKCLRLEDREDEACERDLADYEKELKLQGCKPLAELERYQFRRGWEYLLGRLVGPRFVWGDIERRWVLYGERGLKIFKDAMGLERKW